MIFKYLLILFTISLVSNSFKLNSPINLSSYNLKTNKIILNSSNNSSINRKLPNQDNQISLNNTETNLLKDINQTLIDANQQSTAILILKTSSNQTIIAELNQINPLNAFNATQALNDVNNTFTKNKFNENQNVSLTDNASQEISNKTINDTKNSQTFSNTNSFNLNEKKQIKNENDIKEVPEKEVLKIQNNDSDYNSIDISIRKSKSQENENNDINHLQEIDIIDDIKIKETNKPQLIIVSLDGFRFDFLKMFKNNVGNFLRLAKLGVHAPFGILPAYITQTFASHYSIATGLWEESNGIIDNRFYDPKFDEQFNLSNPKAKFFSGEPIWNTAVRQNLESRIYFWPGSETNPGIGGRLPTEYMKFDFKITMKQQVDKILEWAEKGTDLMMMYHKNPDNSAHRFGIGSKEMSAAIKEINQGLGILIDYVKEKNINLIVTADHGMVHFDKNKLIILEDYLDLKNDIVRIGQTGSIAAIEPKDGKIDLVMNKLSKAPHMKCYKKEDIPEHYHYQNHYRIMPIICIVEITGFVIKTQDEDIPKFGIHGYDNRNPKMRPLFLAMGPDFKKNFITQPFRNINLYSLFTHILNLEPAPNNGSIHNIKHILSDLSLDRLL